MRILFVLLLGVALLGCGDNTSGETTSKEVSNDATSKEVKTNITESDDSGEVKQPKCEDIDGLEVANFDAVPDDYTGVAFECKDGMVIWLAYFKAGERDGLNRAWHENGHQRYEAIYKEGKQDDVSRWWYENGQIESKVFYKDDIADGVCREWYENGQLRYDENYKAGKIIDDKIVHYNEDGSIKGTRYYEDGELVGCDGDCY